MHRCVKASWMLVTFTCDVKPRACAWPPGCTLPCPASQVLEMGRLVDENKVLVGRLGQMEGDLR